MPLFEDQPVKPSPVGAFEPDLKRINLDPWADALFTQREVRIDVLRMDKIHPEISGNKWFKLKYFLEQAKAEHKNRLLSFGGAYSNHLLALAVLANTHRFSSSGIVRGERPASLSPTLVTAEMHGMDLKFFSRQEYDRLKNHEEHVSGLYDPHPFIIPEGGAGPAGMRGAGEIFHAVADPGSYTHICCAAGTGTTLAGLVNASRPGQQMIGVSVLKGTQGLEPLSRSWIKNDSHFENIRIIHTGHFGGYAKKTVALISFMNRLYKQTGIPTDFVYTGKLFYCVHHMVEEKSFPPGSRILILHTGGLQGNRSLTSGELEF